MVNVLIASPLEPRLVDRIASVDSRLNVVYRPDLLGTPRYAGDHFPPIHRTPDQTYEWAHLLAQAEVMLDVDQPSTAEFLGRVSKLRWVQSSSSGVGEWVKRLGLVEAPIRVTNAAGMHARPLAEFAIFAMLYFARCWPRMAAEQRAHHWERCAIETLEHKTLGIIGLGRVGRAVATLAKPFGLRVLAMRRSPESGPNVPEVDTVLGREGLRDLLRESDYVVLCVPHTPETVGLLGADALAAMRPGAVLINIARGSVVDEPALIEALRSGHLGGAALDVVSREPLAADSPLWDMPNVMVTGDPTIDRPVNVIITPHSMSTSTRENEWLVDLFCDNLRRYLAGEPLRNEFNKERGY